MNFHSYFSKAERAVETCVIGAGGFGHSFLAQAQHVPLMNAHIAVDLDSAVAARALRDAGADAKRIRICTTAREAVSAWNAGDFVAANDLRIVLDLPFDVAIEATGHPEAGARHCLAAIAAGKHIALVSKEVDSVAGPGLAKTAADKGLIVTPVDGDQPSLLIGLVSWAEVLGFELVAAGKSSEYDFVFDPSSESILSNGRTIHVPGFSRHWTMGDRAVSELVAARAQAVAALPQRAVPDLCEMLLVANATGLAPDRPDFHAPLARPTEVPTIFSTRGDGGILSADRRIDVFHCLRQSDELSFAGGVFIVVRCKDRKSWDMLAEKGHVISRTGATAMVFIPRHLLGLEAATSVLDAAIHRVSGYGQNYRPRFDLVAVAQADLPAGTALKVEGHHHAIADVTAEVRPMAALSATAPCPFYLAGNRTLTRPVEKGHPILLQDLEFEPDSQLLALRKMQDDVFPTSQA